MKIIVSGNVITQSAPLPAQPAPVLRVIEPTNLEPLESSFEALSEKVRQLETTLSDAQEQIRRPAVSVDLAPLEQAIEKVKTDSKRWQKESQTELEKLMARNDQAIEKMASYIERLEKESKTQLESGRTQSDQVLHKLRRDIEEEMTLRIQAAVTAGLESIKPAAPGRTEDPWESLFQQREATFISLQREVETSLRVPSPAAVPLPSIEREIPVKTSAPPCERPFSTPDSFSVLPADSEPEEPPPSVSVISKVWGYLNQSAVEIPISSKKKAS